MGVRERHARKDGSATGQVNIGVGLFTTHTAERRKSEVAER